MLSLGVISLCYSVYLLFAAAKKVEYRKGFFSLFWETRPLLARSLSLVFMVLGTFLLVFKMGIANGLLASLVTWPTIASLTVLLAPLFKAKKVYTVLIALLVLFGFIILSTF